MGKPTSLVRLNQVLRGTWLNGQRAGEPGGFHLPTGTPYSLALLFPLLA